MTLIKESPKNTEKKSIELFKNTIYSIQFVEDTKTIKFNWEEGHKDMTYENFQEACSNFLGYGFEYRAKSILIDVRNFQFTLPEEFPKWQKNEHYPRYYKLGIEKVAYVMPEEYIAQSKVDKDLKFDLRNFSNMTTALEFLD